jgi:uncharacterized protein (TIGR00251 family)
MMAQGYLQSVPEGVRLRVKVLPRAPRNEVTGLVGDELKIKIAAPPVDAAANHALIEFLAMRLGCPRRDVVLLRGHKSPHKVLLLRGLSVTDVASRLVAAG